MEITAIYIDQAAAKYPESEIITNNIKNMESAGDIAVINVDDAAQVHRAIKDADDPVVAGKQILFLTTNEGQFLKSCPGTRFYQCCGYKILNIAGFCLLDCSYCILQAYFRPPVLQYYVNQETMLNELEGALNHADRLLRIGTGEFTDSMIWNGATDLNARLVKIFSRQKKAVLELKTKTVNIEPLHRVDHNRKTIASWSLNTESVILSEERGSATLAERLEAAAACEQMGYPLAFHFDPIVLYEGCEADYVSVIERLFSSVASGNIVWISLGSFRFMPALKPIVQSRFPESKIVYGEFITGLDGKMRYFKPLRIKAYQAIIQAIRDIAPEVTVYFCMEDDEVWEKCMGFVPKEKGGLPHMLDASAAKHCEVAAP